MRGIVLTILARPLNAMQVLALIAGTCIAVALFCLAYNGLAGSEVTLRQAFGWSAAMIAPWMLAYEAQKRWPGLRTLAALLSAAFLASLLLGAWLLYQPFDAFEVVRRLPALALTTAFALLVERQMDAQAKAASPLPVRPDDIDWVKAAGNYVELHFGERTITHRATLSATEQALADNGFVRIHRSMLVRREAIDRVRSEDIVLRDGTHLKLGKRFRAALAA